MTPLIQTRRAAVLVAVLFMALTLGRNAATPAENLADATLPNPDSYYKLVLLQDRSPAHGLGFVPRDNAPYGNWIHWSRLHSETVWLLHLPLRAAGLAEEAALRYAGGSLTLLSMLLLTAFVAMAVSAVGTPAAAMLSGMTIAASLPLHGYGKLDQITHHVFMLVPLGAAAACLFNRQPRNIPWREFSGGALLGLGLWISPETMPLVVGLSGVRIAMNLQGLHAPRLWPVAIGLGATVTFGWLVDPPPPGFSAWALDHISLSYLLLAGAVGLLFLATDLVVARHAAPGRRLAIVGVIGLLLGAAWLLVVPGALEGPAGLLPEALRPLFWERVQELRPAHTPTKFAAYFMMPLTAALVAASLSWQQKKLWLAALAFMSLAYGLLAVAHMRMGAAAAVASALALGAGASRHPAFAAAAGASTARRKAEGVLIALLPGLQVITVLLLALLTATDEAENNKCSLAPVADALNAIPPATVLTGVFHGPELLYRTHHRVITGPYHHNVDGMLDNFRAWQSTDTEAPPPSFTERNITLVLGCVHFQSDLAGSPDAPSLAQRVASGDVPEWLRPIPWPSGVETPWRLYEVQGPR